MNFGQSLVCYSYLLEHLRSAGWMNYRVKDVSGCPLDVTHENIRSLCKCHKSRHRSIRNSKEPHLRNFLIELGSLSNCIFRTYSGNIDIVTRSKRLPGSRGFSRRRNTFSGKGPPGQNYQEDNSDDDD